MVREIQRWTCLSPLELRVMSYHKPSSPYYALNHAIPSATLKSKTDAEEGKGVESEERSMNQKVKVKLVHYEGARY